MSIVTVETKTRRRPSPRVSRTQSSPRAPHRVGKMSPKPLTGVRAFVTVRTNDGVDCSGVFAAKIVKMGAKTFKDRLTNSLTHIVFRAGNDAEGLPRLRRRMKDAGCESAFIVTPSWITACERAGSRAKEKEHLVPGAESERDAHPRTPLSRWSSVEKPPGSGKTPRNNKRPREVEKVDLKRYDSDVRLMAAQAKEMDEEAKTREKSKRTFADVVADEETWKKRRKTTNDGEVDYVSSKGENDARVANANG